jgi:hypothetical protein
MPRPLLAAITLALALLAAGCRPSPLPNPPPNPPTSPADPGTYGGPTGPAPTPFSAVQLRGASAPGRTWVFAVTLPDGAVARRVLRFTVTGEVGGTLVTTTLQPDGATPLGPPEESEFTWTELESHARFPGGRTRVDEETVETRAGRFEALRYTVEGEGGVTRYWFAKDLPGPPVRMLQEGPRGAAFTMELLEHTPGQRPAPAAAPAPTGRR